MARLGRGEDVKGGGRRGKGYREFTVMVGARMDRGQLPAPQTYPYDVWD